MKYELDIERVLKAAGRREPVPPAIEHAAREQLREEWRAVVAERRGANRRVAFFAAAAGIVVAVAGLFLAASQSGGGAPVGALVVAQNDVRVSSGWLHGTTPATPGLTLKTGESLETGADARAAFSMPGIASARIDSDTRVRVAAADRLVIERGTLYVDAGLGLPGASRLLVETPAGSVRHVGTQYEVRIDGGVVRLRVREGRIEWRSRSGTLESGRAGEQLTIAANGAVAREASPRYGDSWEWTAEAAPSIAVEGRPLDEFLGWAGRELGREVAYASPAVRDEVAAIVVHGSVDGLTPREALDAVLATTSVRGTLEPGRVLVSAGATP
jgi:ferric-dicitrate binding protein FerR (iron transport regulator)